MKSVRCENMTDGDTTQKTAVDLAFEALAKERDNTLSKHKAWFSVITKIEELHKLAEESRENADKLKEEIRELIRSSQAKERVSELNGKYGAALSLVDQYQSYADDLELELEEKALDTAHAYQQYNGAKENAMEIYSKSWLTKLLGSSQLFSDEFFKAAKLRILASEKLARKHNEEFQDNVSAFDLVVNEIMAHVKKELPGKLKTTLLTADDCPEMDLLLNPLPISNKAINDFGSPAQMTKRRKALEEKRSLKIP